jgi:predicted TPR repeat methyltransferase
MEPTERNLRAWEAAHRRAPAAERGLPPQVRESLGEMHDRRVLHLGCGTGAESVGFAELGANVTGVEVSETAVAAAHARAASIVWIHADPEALPVELQRGRFDLVYGGVGTLAGVADLERWAAGAAAALRPGGDLLLFDEHPAGLCVDSFLHWRGDYFAHGLRRLGHVVAAAIAHDLHVRAVEEYPSGTGRDATFPATFLLHARKC